MDNTDNSTDNTDTTVDPAVVRLKDEIRNLRSMYVNLGGLRDRIRAGYTTDIKGELALIKGAQDVKVVDLLETGQTDEPQVAIIIEGTRLQDGKIVPSVRDYEVKANLQLSVEQTFIVKASSEKAAEKMVRERLADVDFDVSSDASTTNIDQDMVYVSLDRIVNVNCEGEY